MRTFAAVQRPRIGFLSVTDPADRRGWSGIPSFMLDELRRRYADVAPLGPFDGGWPLLLGRALNRASLALTGRRIDHAHGDRLARHYARAVEERVARARPDVIVAPAATALLAQARIAVPWIFLSDTTMANMVDYYEAYTGLARRSLRQGMANESAAIRQAAFAVFPSAWAAESAVRDHGARRDRVFVVPFGANFQRFPSREEALAERPADALRLLFLGVDWERKGGPLVLETLHRLRDRGIAARLTIAGVVPPIAHDDGIAIIPFIDKNSPEGERRIQELMLSHHFLFVPSRAECYGIVFCEAASCGLPSIARRTGGIGGAVVEGENGHLLAPEAGAPDYAALIAALWSDCARYAGLQRSARALFERSHNWQAWGDAMEALITRALGRSGPPSAAGRR